MKQYISLLLVLPLLVSCAYDCKEGCHLDKLNVNGNAIRIETIIQSTIPLTELYYGSYGSSQTISMVGGNFVFDFDSHGDLVRTTGFGIDGEILFVSDSFQKSEKQTLVPSVMGVPGQQQVDKIETVSTSDGKIVNAMYYSENELIWNQRVSYNDKGDIVSIIKDYASLNINTDLLNIQYADTTTYEYSSVDEHGNWTIDNVYYKGVLQKHKHDYKVIRQITYDGESEKSPLIKQLKSLNAGNEHKGNVNLVNVGIGCYGRMKIPDYMALQSKDFISTVNDFVQAPAAIDYLFMSVYDNTDAYATLSVSRNYVGEANSFDDATEKELSYDKELDDALKEQYITTMAQGGTYVLKWLPYHFIDISAKRALRLSYYRYGNVNPIPVYCENYIIPMDDGYTLSVIYSFQSNLQDRFINDFNKVINSIRFN